MNKDNTKQNLGRVKKNSIWSLKEGDDICRVWRVTHLTIIYWEPIVPGDNDVTWIRCRPHFSGDLFFYPKESLQESSGFEIGLEWYVRF